MKKRRFHCHQAQTFFGLTPEYLVNIQWEELWTLTYWCGLLPTEARKMSIEQRRWWIERTKKELEKSTEEGNTNTNALHASDPSVRQLQGRAREHAPQRLKRFT